MSFSGSASKAGKSSSILHKEQFGKAVVPGPVTPFFRGVNGKVRWICSSHYSVFVRKYNSQTLLEAVLHISHDLPSEVREMTQFGAESRKNNRNVVLSSHQPLDLDRISFFRFSSLTITGCSIFLKGLSFSSTSFVLRVHYLPEKVEGIAMKLISRACSENLLNTVGRLNLWKNI